MHDAVLECISLFSNKDIALIDLIIKFKSTNLSFYTLNRYPWFIVNSYFMFPTAHIF